jgi:hypothetical protein
VSQVNRTETVDPENEYRLLGIRLEGNGPFLREIVSGTETSAYSSESCHLVHGKAAT